MEHRSPRQTFCIAQICLLLGVITTFLPAGYIRDADAMGRILPLPADDFARCGTESADAKFSVGDAQYRVRGKCYVFVNLNPARTPRDPENIESTFENEKLDYIISWEAAGKFTSATKLAEETISVLKRVRPDHENYFAVGKITATMECEQDPWLMPHTGRCTLKFLGKDSSLNAYNLSGLYSVRDIFPASSYLAPELRAALNTQNRWYHALLQKPGTGGQQLIRPDKGLQAKSQVGVVTGSQCNTGFVERLAGPNDNVCVTPESRERARQENTTAASRRDPKGAYGPNTCLTGFVWREAFAGDVVCVTPEIRKLVKEENALHGGRSTGQTAPTQLMRPGTGLKVPSTGLVRPRGMEGGQETPSGSDPPAEGRP